MVGRVGDERHPVAGFVLSQLGHGPHVRRVRFLLVAGRPGGHAQAVRLAGVGQQDVGVHRVEVELRDRQDPALPVGRRVEEDMISGGPGHPGHHQVDLVHLPFRGPVLTLVVAPA